jgi:hypothetical protein
MPELTMSTLVHGVELDREGRPRWMRFGILRLLIHLAGANATEPSVQDWLKRLHSDEFRQLAAHYFQCFQKFDRAAGHVARCRETVNGALERFSERVRGGEVVPPSDPDRRAIDEANADLPLYLDGMLFYLRIQADTYARLVTFFYPGRDAGKIRPNSFREQFDWFTQTRPNFDRGYASVLRANRKWFDRLAHRPTGLRNVVIHHGGMLIIGWVKPEDGPIEARTALYSTALYTNAAIVEPDVCGALREITSGWFAFLDAAWLHFVTRLTAAGVLSTMSASEVEKTRYAGCSEGDRPGLWAYPTFTNPEL